jgi:hypothetical protein
MLIIERYLDQLQHWPRQGRHILAQFDEQSVIVYQAYKPSIAHWTIQHQRLGGPDFSYNRMSWIKPNFLWMMYRSGWGTKHDQQVTLALRLRRAFFEGILGAAVESSFSSVAHVTHVTKEAWQAALEGSEVRLQWDPDHDPHGRPEERRAIQLGLRGEALKRMGQEALLEVHDLSNLVSEQRKRVQAGELRELQTPRERLYLPGNQDTRLRLGLSPG